MSKTSLLFSSYRLGKLELPNRIVMAPMTRCRCVDNIPGDVVAEYYTQRATAGLLITEGVSPSPNGLGYARIPGIFSPEQVEAWRKVTSAVHEAGGRIAIQLMHVGRIGHPANLPEGAELVAPSAVAAKGQMYTDSEGMQEQPTPREMNLADIASATEEYVQAARNAVAAGFDAVELHGANGYLLDQFQNPSSNRRTDAYGGDFEGRCRFVIETSRAVAETIGKDRTGIRLSPFGVFNDQTVFDEIEDQYAYLARELGALGLAFVHIVDHAAMGAPPVPAALKRRIRRAFGGTVILSGGYDASRAEEDLRSDAGELVAFGRPFISNPDLVARLAAGRTLAEPNADTFYTPGPEGYVDYPSL